MNGQIQRLETLLARVQRNRHLPRAHAGASALLAEQAVKEAAIQDGHPAPQPFEHELFEPRVPKAVISRAEISQRAEAAGVQPVKIVAAAVVRPAEAIGKVISERPKIEEPTFGQLLRRSLSLRPS